jgi:transglutaminase-like putative cysteine protease
MEHEQDASARRQRFLALGAVAALTAAMALAFGRVFTGTHPTWELVLAAVGSVAVAGLFERRGLALALLASAAGLALALTWIVYPQTAWYGLPSIRTLRAIGRSLEFVGQQARLRVAPSPPLAPLLLAAVTSTWTAAFSTHALAIRAGSPLLAVLPSVALVGFADTVLVDGPRPGYAVLFLSAVLAVVFADGLRRVRQWGPMWFSFRKRRISSVASRGARRIALAALLCAVLLPGLLPGFRATALVDFSTGGDDGIGLDPFVSILAQLEQEEPVDLFEVTSPDGAAYWRLYALDRFDGTTWSSSDPLAEQGQVLGSPATLQPSPVPATEDRIVQNFTILRGIDDPWLPMAHPAEEVTVPFGELRYNQTLGSVVLSDGLEEGLQYTVTSRVVAPSPAELDLVAFDAPARYGHWTDVPESVPPRVRDIALAWTADAATPYRQILALQNRFRNGPFVYTLDVDPVEDGDALVHFLEESRRGFCQQYATAMAIMARELGYPARVAVGFREGTREVDTYTVDSRDAHAWVEVFFPGWGWLPFEPTPTRANPIETIVGSYSNSTAQGDPDDPAGQEGAGTGVGSGVSADCRNPSGRPLPRELCGRGSQEIQGQPGRTAGGALPPGFLNTRPLPERDEDGYSIPYRWIFLAILAVGALLLILVPIAKWTWRRRALHGAGDPRERVLAAYRVFDGVATDLGLGRRDGETVEEHRARLSASVAFSDGHLGRLAQLAERAAYGSAAPGTDEADAATKDARTAIADLRKDAGVLRRIVGTYRPGL